VNGTSGHEPLFILSREDWSLHRKGYQDQARHRQKVLEAIRRNLPDLISEENIILSNGRQIVKIPIRSLDEYHFVYNREKRKHVGQGAGDSRVGDVLGRDPASAEPGKEGKAGDQPGFDVTEAEISVAELERLLFEELELPFMLPRERELVSSKDIRFHDIRRKGLSGNIDRKRTLLENLKRNAREGRPAIGGISPEDLRYKTWEDVPKSQNNAVILAMMDTSGSMGSFEKYCARSFFFWMTRFLRHRYEKVEIVFIAHHTEAKEVSEEHFFTRGESGGTICSSAYAKALEIIDERYPPSRYNLYPIHFSDGDNLTSDNERCLRLIEQLLERANLFGYGEVNQYNRSSTLMSAFRNLNHPRFLYYIIRDKSDIYHALKAFFRKRPAVGTT